MKRDKNITVLELADKLGVTDKTIKRDIAKLKSELPLAKELEAS